MIFGLAFATFLTLLLVPAMYLIAERSKRKSEMILDHLKLSRAWMYFPFFVLICRAYLSMRGQSIKYGDLDY
jgi:hypothetical protein